MPDIFKLIYIRHHKNIANIEFCKEHFQCPLPTQSDRTESRDVQLYAFKSSENPRPNHLKQVLMTVHITKHLKCFCELLYLRRALQHGTDGTQINIMDREV